MIDLNKPPAYVLRFLEHTDCKPNYPSGCFLVLEFFCSGEPCVSAVESVSQASRFTWEAANLLAADGVHGIGWDSEDMVVYPEELEMVCVPEFVGQWLCLEGETSQ
jgi:hypothetical protein